MQTTSPHRLPPAAPPPPRFASLVLRSRNAVRRDAPPAASGAALLTHHQIVALAAPFAHRGHTLNLAASDRLRRSLVFHAVRHEPALASAVTGDDIGSFGMLETLQLDGTRPGHFRLTRTLREDGGLHATLQAEGPLTGDLLARVQSVPGQRQFHVGAGYRMACSGSVEGAEPGGAGFQMSHALIRTQALTLDVNVSSASSAAATSAAVDIQPRHRGDALPADLLAVLGWDWSMLQAGATGWQGSMRLRGDPATRSAQAEHKLRVAAAHLARTLAEPPPRFDERLRVARLGVLARHAIPLLVCALLVIGVLFAEVLRDARGSPLTFALMCLPAALLLLFMLRSERPRLALPSWPRPLAAQAWRAPR